MHHNSNIKINQVYQIVEDLGINQKVCFRIGTVKGGGVNNMDYVARICFKFI